MQYLFPLISKMLDVGEWVSTGVGKRDDSEGDTVEVTRLCG